MWPLTFISQSDFENHVKDTIIQYSREIKPYGLPLFNSNIIDPIKLIFDKAVYRVDWESIIKNEIHRQRDKSTNNDVGYFHQRLFKYIDNCTVPQEYWDVIYKNQNGISLPDGNRVHTVYVEMKNKYNTMNSSSSADVYKKMQSQLLRDDDCACFLVEVIAKKSQNINWVTTIDSVKQSHVRIRRVSIDAFYQLVTGQQDAFYQICRVLPRSIEKAMESIPEDAVPHDTVFEELRLASKDDGSIDMAIFMLGFGGYKGFPSQRKNDCSQMPLSKD